MIFRWWLDVFQIYIITCYNFCRLGLGLIRDWYVCILKYILYFIIFLENYRVFLLDVFERMVVCFLLLLVDWDLKNWFFYIDL